METYHKAVGVIINMLLYLGIDPFLICKILDLSQYLADDPSIASFTMESLPYNEFFLGGGTTL